MAGTAVRKVSDVARRGLPTDKVVRKIFEAFNTWAFKREQPSDAVMLRDVVERAVMTTAPVPFVLYWGKGPRNHLAEPDEACLDYLASMGERIRAEHAPGAAFEILLTDTHARLNRHNEAEIETYYRDIDAAASKRGFRTRRLSEVVASVAPAPVAVNDAAIDPDLLIELTKSASKWYGGEGAARFGAIQYYAMNMTERRAVEAAYPHAIFATFNDNRFRQLFPANMPIFYMYSLRKGFGVKPWFIGDVNETATAAPARA